MYFFDWPTDWTTHLVYLLFKYKMWLYSFFIYLFIYNVGSLSAEYSHLKQEQHLSCCWFHVLGRNLDGINLCHNLWQNPCSVPGRLTPRSLLKLSLPDRFIERDVSLPLGPLRLSAHPYGINKKYWVEALQVTSWSPQHLVELLNITLSRHVIPHNAHFSKSAPIWINPAIQLYGCEISAGTALISAEGTGWAQVRAAGEDERDEGWGIGFCYCG